MSSNRQFNASGTLALLAASTLLAGCGGGGELANAITTREQATALATTATPLFTLGVNSAVGGSLVPFTAGQPLRQGQVPAGSVLVAADVPELQFVVKNRWPDGSAKFALVSGRTSLTAGSYRSIGLGVAPAPATVVAPISLANLKAANPTASVQFASFGTVNWSAGDWDRPVQQVVSGPQMSAWTYRKPIGADPHLVAWLEVRAYKGGQVEVLPWIENGYLNVAGPTSKAGTAVFTLGGRQRFSQPLTLLNHQRAVLASGTTLTHWLGTDPQVAPRHDAAYFSSTRLVPGYSAVPAATSSLYSRLPTSYTPLMQGFYPPEMGQPGYHPTIGLLPEWDTAYLTTGGDVRAWRGMIISAYAAGRYGIHYRDETTQRPLAFSKYPYLAMRAGSGVSDSGGSSKSQYTPATSGAVPPRYAASHHPSMGYMAYLVSGWNYFLEENQFVATANYLKQADNIRQGSKGILQPWTGALTTRGAGWALRSLAQAATITPDGDGLRNEFVASINANIEEYHTTYIVKPANPLGLVRPYSSYTTSDPWTSAIWMEDFVTAAFGYLRDLQVYDAALQPKLEEFNRWKFRSVVGRLGGSGANEFAWPYAAQYTVNYAPSLKADWVGGTGPWYQSWGEVARAMNIPMSGEMGGAMMVGYPGIATAYWGTLTPALTYAVEQGAEGAALAWQRMASSSTYPTLVKSFNDNPVWSVYPRPAQAASAAPSMTPTGR
ncbi:hypothetical protein [Azohydromonas aeria]|uniref:hypothetical protein n=1 Tax=Azohydromonas aeria TaxID=2590212 RepID=UPI0012F9BDAB|nr:hypothetical protein [Azohydromonas aeria]